MYVKIDNPSRSESLRQAGDYYSNDVGKRGCLRERAESGDERKNSDATIHDQDQFEFTIYPNVVPRKSTPRAEVRPKPLSAAPGCQPSYHINQTTRSQQHERVCKCRELSQPWFDVVWSQTRCSMASSHIPRRDGNTASTKLIIFNDQFITMSRDKRVGDRFIQE